MQFDKAPQTSTQHLALLRQRGLAISQSEVGDVYATLANIGYYRFTGYCIPFQVPPTVVLSHQFKDGVSFTEVKALIEFDSCIRSLCSEALQVIEISCRTRICSYLSSKYGAHWFLDASVFEASKYADLLSRIYDAVSFDPAIPGQIARRKGSSQFLDHYYAKYTVPPLPPGWMLAEVANFNLVNRIFSSITAAADRQAIAQVYKLTSKAHLDEQYLRGWMHSLAILRNRCAHHSRIVARRFPFSPAVAKSVQPLFPPATDTLNALLVVIWLMLRTIDPKSMWRHRLFQLFSTHSRVDFAMAAGFPADWEAHPIWTSAL